MIEIYNEKYIEMLKFIRNSEKIIKFDIENKFQVKKSHSIMDDLEEKINYPKETQTKNKSESLNDYINRLHGWEDEQNSIKEIK